jgi:hypothetical protein
MRWIVNLLSAFLFIMPAYAPAQAPLPWLIAPDEGYEAVKIENAYLLLRKEGQLQAMTDDGTMYPVPYPNISTAGKGYFFSHVGDLRGLWHPRAGELIPPVYEALFLAADSLVAASRYGMNALVSLNNTLLHPYQPKPYNRLDGRCVMYRRDSLWTVIAPDGSESPLSQAKALKYLGNGAYLRASEGRRQVVDAIGWPLIADSGEEDYQLSIDGATWWAKRGKAWGKVDARGRVLVPFEYAEVRESKAGAPVTIVQRQDNRQWALLDGQGQQLLAGAYEAIQFSSAERAQITANKKHGCLNLLTLEEAIPPLYDQPLDCAAAVMPVRQGRQFGYVSASNEAVTPIHFAHAEPFSGGLAAVQLTRRRAGLINLQGEYVADTIYLELHALGSPGYLGRDTASQWHFILPDGQRKLIPGAKTVSRKFRNGWLEYRNEAGLIGFLDESGEVAIPATFEQVIGADQYKALAVRRAQQWGVLKYPSD